MKKQVTLKEVILSDNWQITNAKQGFCGRCRIDAKTRHHVPDGTNYYSEWHSIDYVNKLRREKGYVKIQDSPYWIY